MKKQLNDLEVSKIEAFCKDKEMYEAVKKVLFAVVYSEGVISKEKDLVTTNGAFGLIANAYSQGKDVSNDELGAQLRAKFEGVHAIVDGFDKLSKIKKETAVKSPIVNEAV